VRSIRVQACSGQRPFSASCSPHAEAKRQPHHRRRVSRTVSPGVLPLRIDGGKHQPGYGCVDGEFRAWIDNDEEPYAFVVASAQEPFGDVRIEADVRFAEGAEAGAYLLCRGGPDVGIVYAFKLGADGYLEIADYLDNEEQIVRMNSLPQGALLPGWNRVRADCLGSKLSFYLNGNLVLEREIEGEHSARAVSPWGREERLRM